MLKDFLKRARRETRKLRTYLGRVLRNVTRGTLKLSAKQEQIVRVANGFLRNNARIKARCIACTFPR